MDFKHHPNTRFKDIDELDRGEAEKEAAALRKGIDYHDYLYYVKNKPEISDAVYDKLLDRLKTLESAFSELQTPDSPTRRVGAEPVDELEKVAHAEKMLSLDAALEEKKARNFYDTIQRNAGDEKVAFVLEPKFDGLSVEIVYENGVFERGATRGSGTTGEDISQNIRTIRTVPLHLLNQKQVPAFLSLRAEVFMSRQGFQRLNKARIEKGETPFANPRNAAAGTMRQLDPKNVADKPLDIFFYEILKTDAEVSSSHWDVLKKISEWGLKTHPHNKKCGAFKAIRDYRRRLSEQRDDFDYEIDGIVVKLDDYELRRRLGVRQRSPRWAFAWKFSPKNEVTRLVDIVVQVGRTGKLTPVGLLEPVDVGGVTVSRATLHNQDNVRKKDVRPGDRVRVVRAGDVIPEIVERVQSAGKKRGKKFSMPEKCPSCEADILREGAYHVCPAGLSCRSQLIGGIIHYASREALDIEGLGEKTAKDLVEKGLVGDLADLYRLSVDDLLALDGFAKKSATRLHDAIQGAESPPLDRFQYGLGIRHVGRRAAWVLAKAFNSLEGIQAADAEDLRQTPEIGPEIARSVDVFFSQKRNRDVLKRMLEAGVRPQESASGQSRSALKGKTFVFTGKLGEFTRDEAEEQVALRDGRATSSVSKKTDYLVAGKDPGGKTDQAKNLGVEIIDEKKFKELIGK